MIENNYAITIVLDYIGGELLYKATAAKFPDILAYGSSPTSAHRNAIEIIRDLVGMAHDMKHPIPEPDYVEPLMQ